MPSIDLEDANFLHETGQESDDDSEVYFLKPVNEYNIVDKIREANKELFSDETGISNDTNQQSRRVSFAANLEEYEPQNGINLHELEETLGKTKLESIEEAPHNIEPTLDVIDEEEPGNENETIEICESIDQENIQEENTDMVDNGTEDNLNEVDESHMKNTQNGLNDDENVILEEICEEILLMDMENDHIEARNVTRSDSSSSVQRKISKQITFDYTEDDDEVDNQSLTNILICDNESDLNKDEIENREYNCNESVNGDGDTEDTVLLTNSEFCEDDEEDDKLSIIVASYLPNDMVCDRTMKRSPRSSKGRKTFFNKRFSFRRKNKFSNAIGCCSNHHPFNNRRFMPPPEVTDLKLQYKACCEYKNEEQNLPHYTGYYSEYGLSKEQLVERERKLQQKQHSKVVEKLKTTEENTRKMHDNERAFTTWLKNKMRFPINKTRNMFDVKRTFGIKKSTSLSGNNVNDDAKQFLNTTKYRSISAKLKKA